MFPRKTVLILEDRAMSLALASVALGVGSASVILYLGKNLLKCSGTS